MIAQGRRINYLRISITDRCNFRCRYCMTGAPFPQLSHNEVARYEEILTITRLACELGITKVRITGGEPFARKGIFSFLERLSQIPGLGETTITTNGALLDRQTLKRLRDLGIKRLNFSLDALEPDLFSAITRTDAFDRVWQNICTAHELGMAPVKINAVILAGINDSQIEALAGLTLDRPFHVRFIEYMPMGTRGDNPIQPVLAPDIRKAVEDRFGPLEPETQNINDGPAKKFRISGAKGIVGFITPVSSHFCAQCNRLRLTARGTLRPCLLDNRETDILGPLRNHAGDSALKEIILDCVHNKPDRHHLADRKKTDIPISHMTSIGG